MRTCKNLIQERIHSVAQFAVNVTSYRRKATQRFSLSETFNMAYSNCETHEQSHAGHLIVAF